MFIDPAVIALFGLSFLVFLLLGAALALLLFNMRQPRLILLAIVAALVVVATITVVAMRSDLPALPWFFSVIPALFAIAIAVLGGNPVTRAVLNAATKGRVNETEDGGITLPGEGTKKTPRTILRGGTTIGYLERTAIVLTIIAGFPEGIAIVVAVKGIGRFSELDAAEARERFIIGTLASLVWACVLGVVARLLIW